jgi:Transposase DDE domain
LRLLWRQTVAQIGRGWSRFRSRSEWNASEGEWLLEKHGTATRRSWRMLHPGVDAGTGRIVAATLTTKDVDDASQAGPLLDQVAGPVASFIADGAYD